MEAANKPVNKPTAGTDTAAAANAGATMNTGNGTTGCAVGSGKLPGVCAPMVYPYVPMQENNPSRYSQNDAMRAGTLFPGLNLPFHKEIRSRFPAENTALSELMALDFAIDELGLYLTTHPDDSEVLELYWSYIRLGRQGREKYEEMYGPLMQTDITPGSFKWLNDPWPWDMGGNV